MKKTWYLLIMILVILGCQDEVQEPKEDGDRLMGTWKYGATGYIKRNDVDITNEYAGLSIYFQQGRMEVTGGGNLFPVANDVWTYTKLDKTGILRASDDLEMDVEVTESTLILRFPYTYTIIIPGGGRVSGISGNYEIRLERSI